VGYDSNKSSTPTNATDLTENYGKIGNTGGHLSVILASKEQGSLKIRYRCDRADDSSEHGGLTGIEINDVKTYTQRQNPNNENNENDWLGWNTWQNDVATIPARAADYGHENRPPYYVLAFIMRVK
jgi:hypothetical protein